MCGSCLKQDKLTFNHKAVVNIYIVYKINLWSFKQGEDFTLENLLVEGVNILDMVLDLMHTYVFSYLIVVGLLKT